VKLEASKKVAPIDTIVPPHSTGGAVDVIIMDSSGEILDMGAGFNDLTVATYTNYVGVSPVVAKNRKMLVLVMEKSGFVNYPTEWWHWSYGDQYWAAMTGAECSILKILEFNATLS
jgi:D-alanyl-D-alanine dipeptidase